jgi:hypothetical protein
MLNSHFDRWSFLAIEWLLGVLILEVGQIGRSICAKAQLSIFFSSWNSEICSSYYGTLESHGQTQLSAEHNTVDKGCENSKDVQVDADPLQPSDPTI